MKVLVAIASSEMQHVGSLRTCYTIKQRDGDRVVDSWLWRGDVAREAMLDELLSNDYWCDEDAILMLDADQRHPDDMLEKLRAHDLDMVCAHYYRRETKPIQSLCYEIGDGKWPYLPMLHPPTEGLHEIAVTGFGCVLIKKKVFKAVQGIIPPGMSPISIAPLPEVSGDHANWGPDFRFFHLARKLGYKLWLDASVQSLHGVTIWMGHESARKLANYTEWADASHDLFMKRLEMYGMQLEAFKQRKRILEARLEGLAQQAEEAGKKEDKETWERASIAIYQVQGKIMEMEAWIEWAEKYPAIERPDQLPTTVSVPKQAAIPDETPDEKAAKQEREEVYRDQALDLIDSLPEVDHAANKQ